MSSAKWWPLCYSPNMLKDKLWALYCWNSCHGYNCLLFQSHGISHLPPSMIGPVRSESSQANTTTSTHKTPRRSPRLLLAHSPIGATTAATQSVKRKRGHCSKNFSKAKRRLIKDGSQGETLFGSIINRLEPDLTYDFRTEDGTTYLEITRTEVDIKAEHGGPLPGARIIVTDMGLAYFQPEGGERDYLDENVFKEPHSLDMFLSKLGSGRYYCSGIPKNIYDEHTRNIRYVPNHYAEETKPVHAVRTDSCKRWFYMKRRRQNPITQQLSCPDCNAFFRYVRRSNSRNDIPDTQRHSRLDISSKFQYKFLSPASAKARRKNVRVQRYVSKRKCNILNAQLEKTKLTLEQEQSREMTDIVAIINEKYQADLTNIWDEAEKERGSKTKELLKEIWEKDTSDRTDFFSWSS